MTTPLSYWIGFHAALIALMALEYLLHRAFPNPQRKALYAIALWTGAALLLAALLYRPFGALGATQYLAGYFLEESLSIDNLFVFLVLFGLFRIPEARQARVLFWGVLGAIVLRGLFILAGVNLLNRFPWIGYGFAVILLIAALRLLKPEDRSASNSLTADAAPAPPVWLAWLTRLQPISPNQHHFFVREVPSPPQAEPSGTVLRKAEPSAQLTAASSVVPAATAKPRLMGTILLLALIAVELTDVVFALDSIPAVLSITRQPFLAYTSNIMAVMGLRSLYILMAATLSRLRFLHYGLAAILAFAALKMLLAHRIEISPLLSLLIMAVLLGITVTASLLARRPASAGARA